MKKLFMALISLLLICSLMSCGEQIGKQNNNTEASSEKYTSAITSDNLYTDANPPKPSEIWDISIADVMYSTLEERIDSCTHIVKATYIGTRCYDGYFEHKFKVESQIKGNIEEEYIFMHNYTNVRYSVGKENWGYTYYDSDIVYTLGSSYILLLRKSISVYYEHDYYFSACAISLKCGETPSFTIYGGEPLTNHSSASEETFLTESNLIKYLSEQAEVDTTKVEYTGREYIHSTDMNTIIDCSEYVMKVVVKDIVTYSAVTDEPLWYGCDVVKVYKGEVSEEYVKIRPMPGAVTIGGEYIFALVDYGEKTGYGISSKNSQIDVEQEDLVLSYIND